MVGAASRFEPADVLGAGRAHLGTMLASGLLLVVAVGVAFEPRLSVLGVPGFVERFNTLRVFGAVSFGLSGALLVAVRPANRVGWLLFGVGAAHGLSVLGAGYGLAGIHDPAGSLPGQGWAMWVSEWLWAPAFFLVPTVLLLIFPSGALPSARWRPIAGLGVVAAALSAAGWALLPPSQNDVAGLFPAGYVGPAPVAPRWGPTLLEAGIVTGIVAIAGSLVGLVLRYRRSRAPERQQLEWVLVASFVMVVLLAGGGLLGPPVGPLLAGLAMLPLPVAGAVAVIQHRLWDIDLVFSRSLQFGLLTLAMFAVYGLSTALLGWTVGSRTGAPLVALAVVAIGVVPGYRWVHRMVNRLVYGARDDPGETLRELGTMLAGAGAPEDVLGSVTRAIGTAMRVPYVAIVTSGRIVASHGHPVADTEPVPLHHLERNVGTLVLGTDRGDRLRASDRAAIEALAPHLAVVVHARHLADELHRSHQRLLAAHTDERRRLRRELHDGLGPTLAGLALEGDRCRLLAAHDPGAASQFLDDLSDRIRATVGVVRAIIDDSPLPPLDEHGLAGALDEVATQLSGTLAIDVHVPTDLPDLPADVELAAYHVAAEAMANAVRHSHARHCTTTLEVTAGHLEVRIADDGCGIAADHTPGIGLASMEERAIDRGGQLTISTGPDAGTSVTAAFPLSDTGR